MQTVTFQSTIRGGLPVVVEATVDGYAYEGSWRDGPAMADVSIDGVFWSRNGRARGPVPAHLLTASDILNLEEKACEQ